MFNSNKKNYQSNLPDIIDNKAVQMYDDIINTIKQGQVKRVDIFVAFFYFSGWKLLAKYLEDIPVRILVGNYIDPKCVEKIYSKSKKDEINLDLTRYAPRDMPSSRLQRASDFIESFTKVFNETSLFDDHDQQESLSIFENKIKNGSLEIKLNIENSHEKLYLFLADKVSQSHVYMGSSNFTYNGLKKQGELNEKFSDIERIKKYEDIFNQNWGNSECVDLVAPDSSNKFLGKLHERLWLYKKVIPYHMYLRVLHETFGLEDDASDIKTPEAITNKKYLDLKYQVDAIQSAIEKIKKYSGVIIADVVGLGKSIIASCVAHNLQLRIAIIAPPHLYSQWDDYQAEFKLRGTQIFSSGNINEFYEKFKNENEPILFIIDEAHRFRNEDNEDYKKLWNITKRNVGHKVMLLTATPFNNDPKDIFALIKLFQTPGCSTIYSIDNLSMRFRELIGRYKKLNRNRSDRKLNDEEIKKEAKAIASGTRRLIENVIIRRSRLDLEHITKYKKDLDSQNISFPEVPGPELKEYKLGPLSEIYTHTLTKLSDKNQGFKGARYKPTTYLKDEKLFFEKHKADLEEIDLRVAQTNLAIFMKRLLVMRFESSVFAFKKTLKNIIESNEIILSWYEKVKQIPISKKGEIPNPKSLFESDDDLENFEEEDKLLLESNQKLAELKNRGFVFLNIEHLTENFLLDLRHDVKILKEIREMWEDVGSSLNEKKDPKLEGLIETLKELLKQHPDRKIVVFSSYADTIDYLGSELKDKFKVFLYTSKAKNKQSNKTLKQNFDAGLNQSEQKNEFSILLATDAISEGYNLNRAGVIINYDIPYNPTRVIQRIGRINRINKKVFDKLYIYNYFPTAIGEDTSRIREISTLKVKLINEVIGSDTQTLTNDEEVRSFFLDEYKKSEKEQIELSWDAPYREDYEQAKEDNELMKEVCRIPARSRVIRQQMPESVMVGFGKKGSHGIFAIANNNQEVKICATEDALGYFKASSNELGQTSDNQYDRVFVKLRDELFKPPKLPDLRGRREKALDKIEAIKQKNSTAKNYCQDLREIIEKYDDISEGALKDISKIKITDVNEAFNKLKNIFPEEIIMEINKKVEQIKDESEVIVLSQEHRT